MSNMEPFRSQQFAAEGNRWADTQRNQAISNIGSTAQQTVQQLHQWQQQDQEMSMRLQMFEVERAIKQRQLQELMAVDMAEQSRLQSESMKVQIEAQRAQTSAMQWELSEKQRSASEMPPHQRRLIEAWERLRGVIPQDPVERASAGWDVDERGMPVVRQKNDPRYKAGLEQAIETRKATQSVQYTRLTEAGRNIRQQITTIMQKMDSIKPPGMRVPLSPEMQKEYDALGEQLQGYQQMASDILSELGFSPPTPGQQSSSGIDFDARLQELRKAIEENRPR